MFILHGQAAVLEQLRASFGKLFILSVTDFQGL
jgi:hypothetical protein